MSNLDFINFIMALHLNYVVTDPLNYEILANLGVVSVMDVYGGVIINLIFLVIGVVSIILDNKITEAIHFHVCNFVSMDVSYSIFTASNFTLMDDVYVHFSSSHANFINDTISEQNLIL